MNVNFEHKKAGSNDPVVFEQIFAEKPGGGLVGNQTIEVPAGTAVQLTSGKFQPLKAYRLLKAVTAGDTTIDIAKGSGATKDDVIGNASVAVKATALDTTTNADKDVLTVTLGVAIPVGTVLFEAAAASANAALPKGKPVYVTGQIIEPNKGDQLVKLVNGANLRKETANISNEVAALLPTINLV